MLLARRALAMPAAWTRNTKAMSTGASTSYQVPPLPLETPSLQEETSQFEARVKNMEEFFTSPRFKGIKRPYTARDVTTKQGSLPVLPHPSSVLADKLFRLLGKAASEGKPVHTMGAIDPVQMTQMARHQEVVYVSGWAASSVLTTGNNEVGPDLGCVVLSRPFTSVLMTQQRLSIYHCSKPSPSYLPSPTAP
jgi:isocitrate lyase